MASIASPTFPSSPAFADHNPQKLISRTSRFGPHIIASSSRFSEAALCRCQSQPDFPSSSSGDLSLGLNWYSALRQALKNAINQLDSYANSRKSKEKNAQMLDDAVRRKETVEDKDWDWAQWQKHFVEVDEQERIVSILKSHLGHAILGEDYEDAARLKVAIAAAATNNIISRVMFHFNRAIEEERYKDAALLRDSAGAGLVGWWAGTSDYTGDPYGRIIRVSAEHGRYVARSYSPRQLATATAGVPLFEIFLRINRNGEYRQQAVYLKQRAASEDYASAPPMTGGATGSANRPDPTDSNKTDVLLTTINDGKDGEDRNDDSDVVSKLSNFQNILQDMIPGVKVKVLKVAVPGKADQDLISKVIEQIIEEEDEKDTEHESIETGDEASSESDEEKDEIETEISGGVENNEGSGELSVKVVVGGLINKPTSDATENFLRVPAKLAKKGRLKFSFSIDKDDNPRESDVKARSMLDRKVKLQGQHSINRVMIDLAKCVGREKIPLKVLRDVGELMNLVLSQAQNPQPLSGLTTFNRIEISESPDPLTGLYIGAHGLYASEIVHLSRKYGQWQEDERKQSSDLEFYEYVEALKLTGDPYVPAGQVAFRAKVGKKNRLPHRGIIPEEFGVIARYRGQGRLAEAGFKNPRWVDGELVILDGKYIKGGPVVGFVYWSPEYHFLVFFNRLKLQD